MTLSVTPLEIAQTPEDRALQVRNESMEAAKRYAGKSRPDNTWRGYRSAWERFDTWCQKAHLTALPATPQTVAMFIAAEAVRANAALEHRLAAIRVVHLGAGHPSPHNTLAVLEMMQGVRPDRRGRTSIRCRGGTNDRIYVIICNSPCTGSVNRKKFSAMLLKTHEYS